MASRGAHGRPGLRRQSADQARRAAAAPRPGRPPAVDPHRLQPHLPERARDDVVRRRARLRAARRARRAALRARRRARRLARLARRPPSLRRPRRRGARHGGGARMRVGIVGLPNAGKSSLFNALTKAGAEAANYPFTTIEPNVAVLPVRDERLDRVAATVGSSELVYDTVDFHDIAGLVAGAHKGEGLGNRFLGNIRETDAIV